MAEMAGCSSLHFVSTVELQLQFQVPLRALEANSLLGLLEGIPEEFTLYS